MVISLALAVSSSWVAAKETTRPPKRNPIDFVDRSRQRRTAACKPPLAAGV
jgi:hypothetical protein